MRLRAPCAGVRRAAGWTRTARASKRPSEPSSSPGGSSVAAAAAAPRLASPASPRRAGTRYARLSGPTAVAPSPRLAAPTACPKRGTERGAQRHRSQCPPAPQTESSSENPCRAPHSPTAVRELSFQHRRRIRSASQRSSSSSPSARSAALRGSRTEQRSGCPCPGGPPSPRGGEKERRGRAGRRARRRGEQAAKQGEREGAGARLAPRAATRPRCEESSGHPSPRCREHAVSTAAQESAIFPAPSPPPSGGWSIYFASGAADLPPQKLCVDFSIFPLRWGR